MEKTIAMAKALNKSKGFYFFEPQTMRFFRSKIHGGILKGKYFITSEQNHGIGNYPRLYTIRVMDWDTGDVGTVGEFQQFVSKQQAKDYLNAQGV